jgi:hypothetical protein
MLVPFTEPIGIQVPTQLINWQEVPAVQVICELNAIQEIGKSGVNVGHETSPAAKGDG